MRVSRLFAARLRSQAALLLGIATMIAVMTAVLLGAGGWLGATTEAELRALLIGDTAARSLQVQTRIPEGSAAQVGHASAAEAFFVERFGDDAIVSQALTADVPVRVRWTITVAETGLDADRVHRLDRGFTGLERAIADARIAPRGVALEGALDTTIAMAAAELAALGALAALPFLLAGCMGWLALWQLARLLAGARAQERALLRARGLAGTQSAVLGLGEALLLATVGIGVGGTVAMLALGALRGADGMRATATAWPAVLAGAVLVVATLTVGSSRRPDTVTETASRAGRTAALGVPILLVLAAVLLLWQLHLHGAAPESAPAPLRAVGLLTPLLALAAGIALGAAFLPPLAARGAARNLGLPPVYIARQLARRAAASTLVLAVTAAGAAAAVLAAAYVGSWEARSSARIVANLIPVWWVSAAMGLALALLAIAAVVIEQLRARRAEVGLLRALGVTPGVQARMRAAEVQATAAVGAVLGVLVGVAVAVLVIPELVRVAVPGDSASPGPARGAVPETVTPGIATVFDVPALALALGALLIGVVALAAAQRRAVRAQASVALPDGGAR